MLPTSNLAELPHGTTRTWHETDARLKCITSYDTFLSKKHVTTTFFSSVYARRIFPASIRRTHCAATSNEIHELCWPSSYQSLSIVKHKWDTFSPSDIFFELPQSLVKTTDGIDARRQRKLLNKNTCHQTFFLSIPSNYSNQPTIGQAMGSSWIRDLRRVSWSHGICIWFVCFEIESLLADGAKSQNGL